MTDSHREDRRVNGPSVVIITRDAADTLANTLDSVRELDEVVVYDNGSTDATAVIAGRYPNVRWVTGPFEGFGPTKNQAVSMASCDWVLSLDADEVVSPGFVSEVRDWIANAGPRDVAEIERKNTYLGKPVRHGGWGNDWVVRVFNRTVHGFSDREVHEGVELTPGARVVRLRNPVRHDSVREQRHVLEKIDLYTELYARNHPERVLPLPMILLRAGWSLFKSYVVQLGFLDGWRGVAIAQSCFVTTFYKYFKIYANDRMSRGR